MPYSLKAHKFFELCKTNPGKARKRCPPRAQAAKMASEGVKKAHKQYHG